MNEPKNLAKELDKLVDGIYGYDHLNGEWFSLMCALNDGGLRPEQMIKRNAELVADCLEGVKRLRIFQDAIPDDVDARVPGLSLRAAINASLCLDLAAEVNARLCLDLAAPRSSSRCLAWRSP